MEDLLILSIAIVALAVIILWIILSLFFSKEKTPVKNRATTPVRLGRHISRIERLKLERFRIHTDNLKHWLKNWDESKLKKLSIILLVLAAAFAIAEIWWVASFLPGLAFVVRILKSNAARQWYVALPTSIYFFGWALMLVLYIKIGF